MVQIITDSAADFEPHELKKLGITAIPLTVAFGNEAYRESIDLSKSDFYKLLRKKNNFPTTSQPSPNSFEEAFTSVDKNDELVGIFMSSKLSGTYYGAKMTMRMHRPHNTYLVDSISTTAGEKILVEYAVKLRDKGKTGREIYVELERIKQRLRLFACIESAEHIARGGRGGQTLVKAVKLTHIKPVIQLMENGRPELVHKAIGSKRGLCYIAKRMENDRIDHKFPIYIIHCDNREKADYMKKQLTENGFSDHKISYVNIGAVTGSHIGPDSCGAVYVVKR